MNAPSSRFSTTLPPAVMAALLFLTATLWGCAVNRPTLSPAKLAEVRQTYLTKVREDTYASNQKMLARIRMEEDDYLASTAAGAAAPRPVYDILILSGGGDYGAFGAGVLKGWGGVADSDLRRPVFDMVTGVSTGALIAPFAYVGTDLAIDRLVGLYSRPKQDWFSLRGWLFFLPGNESFMDNKGLRRDVQAAVDQELIERMAAASKEHRVLAVNATNLDVGEVHPFSLGTLAEKAVAEGDTSRIYDVMMASSAIPAIYPPVIIDGALYVDGGTTSNILYGFNWLSPKAPIAMWRAAYPHEPFPKLRFWVIINNQLGTGATIVQPTWMSITKSSLATSIRASTKIALRHLYTQVQLLRTEGLDAEFRYIAIPTDWVATSDEPFNQQVMQSLAELGMQMGADPTSWRRDFSE